MAREPSVTCAPDDEERFSLVPLSFEEALQAALAVDPKKVGIRGGGGR